MKTRITELSVDISAQQAKRWAVDLCDCDNTTARILFDNKAEAQAFLAAAKEARWFCDAPKHW